MGQDTPINYTSQVSIFGRFPWVGEALCVDFANSMHSIDNSGDAVDSWPALVAFLEGTGVVDHSRVAGLLDLETAAPAETDAALRGALGLRQAVSAAIQSIANRHAAPDDAVAAVNSILRLTMGHDQLVPSGDGWALRFVQREKRLEWLLAAIARSAADLIVEGAAAPLRKCADPRCPLYFYDTSRQGNRRWCSMETCGNRAKVAAFARRQKLRAKDREPTRRRRKK